MRGIPAWRVTVEIPGKDAPIWSGDVTVWARTEESAGEVAQRCAAKIGHCDRYDPADYWTRDVRALTGQTPEVEAPRAIGLAVWSPDPARPPYLRRERWRGIGEIIREINARIDASDLSVERRGASVLMARGVDDSPTTIPDMFGARDSLWRVGVVVMAGANEGHLVDVYALGQASGAGRVAIDLYSIKCLTGEDEAETIARCLRNWIEEG